MRKQKRLVVNFNNFTCCRFFVYKEVEMKTITFELLIENVKSYNEEEVLVVTKAYEYAKNLHEGQKRKIL